MRTKKKNDGASKRKNFLVVGGVFSLLMFVLMLTLLLVTIFAPVHSLFIQDDFAKQRDAQISRFLVTGNEDVFTPSNLLIPNQVDQVEIIITQKEISHLRDVRKLLGFAVILCLASFRLFMACWNNQHPSRKYRVKRESKLLPTSQERLLMIVGALGFFLHVLGGFLLQLRLFNISFSQIFFAFHLVFFPQGNFSFPLESFLIGTYSQSFFASMMIMWLVLSFVFLMIFSLIYYTNYVKKPLF